MWLTCESYNEKHVDEERISDDIGEAPKIDQRGLGIRD
jgi:hypothetical protein